MINPTHEFVVINNIFLGRALCGWYHLGPSSVQLLLCEDLSWST